MLFLKWSIIQEFFDQVYMAKQHSSTTISLQSKGIQSITKKHEKYNIRNWILIAINILHVEM